MAVSQSAETSGMAVSYGRRQGTSVSARLTEAAADKLRNEFLGAALDRWEAEDEGLDLKGIARPQSRPPGSPVRKEGAASGREGQL